MDLKKLVVNYQYDLMGELAFDDSFGAQLAGSDVPNLNDHFYLSCLYGMVPSILPWAMKIGNYIPLPWFRHLVKARIQLREQRASQHTMVTKAAAC